MSLEGWTHSFANFSNSLVLSNIFPCVSLESAYLLWLHRCSNSLPIFNESGCLWACVVLCVHVCVCVCLSVSEISLSMDGQAESGGWCLSPSSVVLIFRHRLSRWTGRSLHWLSRKSLQSVCLCLPTLGLQMCGHAQLGHGFLNSSAHAYEAYTSPLSHCPLVF